MCNPTAGPDNPKFPICQCCPGQYGGGIICPGASPKCLATCSGKCAANGDCPKNYICKNQKCVLGTACTPNCPSGYCGKETKCGTICPCPSGTTCQNNKCIKTVCTPNCPSGYCGKETKCGTICPYTCPKGTTCQSNECVTTPPPPTGIKINVNNKCNKDIWLTLNNRLKCGHNRDTDCSTTYKGNFQNKRLVAGTGSAVYAVSPGLQSAQFIVKSGCDSTGERCKMGQALPPCGDPGNPCQPNYTTKFEASYTDNAVNYDTSFVDGYSLPMKVEQPPGGTGQDCGDFDCGGLTLASCPSPLDLSTDNKYPTYTDYTKNNPNIPKSDWNVWDLTKMDMKVYDKYDSSHPPKGIGNVIGCFSPCEKLSAALPWGPRMLTTDKEAKMYCCPNVSVEACRAGPGGRDSPYTKFIHDKCAHTYAYSFDDIKGGHACTGANKDITVTFCP